MIDPRVVDKLTYNDKVDTMIGCLIALHQKGEEREKILISIQGRLETLTKLLEENNSGFPAGDPDGHRRYHEAVIRAMENRNRIVRECLVKAGSASILAGLGWLGWAVWHWFKLEVKA